MSTYYEYRDVKVMIAHKLMSMDGWKVYGYHADQSDAMTDYWDPADWSGIAEKNGYVLCVNRPWAEKAQEIRQYNYDGFVQDRSIMEKIEKLSKMTVDRGASEQEEQTAKAAIEKLRKKTGAAEKYVVVGMIPEHLENPPRMNWHIEKDGIIVAKGNGILKYSKIDSYYKYSSYMEDMTLFRKSRAAYRREYMDDLRRRHYYDSEERISSAADYQMNQMEESLKLINQFEAFIRKIDTTCGGLIGEGDGSYYEKVKVTEYKKELKPVETQDGEIREGQCFILKTDFNYSCNKGLVYRIHESEYKGKKYYHAYKLNGKFTKECTGTASRNNHWSFNGNTDTRFLEWVQKGFISWCELQEVKTPYEVEKVVKRTIKKKAC